MFFSKGIDKKKIPRKPGPASRVHMNKAQALKKRAVAARKAKRYLDSFVLDAKAFHEMRLYEVDLYENEIKHLDYSLSIGVISDRERRKGVSDARKFLESWSSTNSALRQTKTAMNKLKLSPAQLASVSKELVHWSLSGGKESVLNRIASRLAEET